MTPEDFATRMHAVADRAEVDTERAHIEADSLIIEAFKDSQFWEGIAVYKAMKKWYS